MSIFMQAMKIIGEDERGFLMRDGCSLLPPLPGISEEGKATKLFACPNLPGEEIYGPPACCFTLDLEKERLLDARDTENVFPAGETVLSADPESTERLAERYDAVYPEFFALSFSEDLERQAREKLRGNVALFEKMVGELLPFYEALMPEFFSWLDHSGIREWNYPGNLSEE